MSDTAVFTKERKGYSCAEVDKFLLEQNARHNEVLAEKDAEIKRMFSENEDLKSRLEASEKRTNSLLAEFDEFKKHSTDDAERMNARLGENLSAAEEASSDMLKKAEAECEELKRKCRIQIAEDVAAAHRKAEEYCERARRVADIYVEKQQLVTAGLEQARRHLDDAVRSVDSILDETK